jgi:hypothetical protein
VCVCLLGADGRVVEGRINTLSTTTARSARVRVPSGKGSGESVPNIIACKNANQVAQVLIAHN